MKKTLDNSQAQYVRMSKDLKKRLSFESYRQRRSEASIIKEALEHLFRAWGDIDTEALDKLVAEWQEKFGAPFKYS